MSTDKKERDKILARVRALLSMTTENGCTEAEAMTAAARAAKLMEEHDLAVTDVEALKAEPVKTDVRGYGKTPKSKELHPAARYVAVAVADFFDCRVWYNGNTISFFGMKDDVSLAHDLLKLIQAAMDRELTRFKASGMDKDGPGTVAQSNSFCTGMGARVSERLRHMKAMRTAAVKAKGTDLVVIKSEIVTAAHAKMFGPNFLKKSRARRDPSSEAAFAAGYQAGDRVGLGQKEIDKPAFDSRTRRQRVQDSYEEYRRLIAERERTRAAAEVERLEANRVEAERRLRAAQAAFADLQGQSTAIRATVGSAGAPVPLFAAMKADLRAWGRFLLNQYLVACGIGVFVQIKGYARLEAPHHINGYGNFTSTGLFVVLTFITVWLCAASMLRTMVLPIGRDRSELSPIDQVADGIGYTTAQMVLAWRWVKLTLRPNSRPSIR